MSQPQNSSNTNNANMFRVGDYCFFETQSGASYAIRRIEELNRTSNGNVEARVMCFYRRSEVPPSLLAQVV
jgi:metastasis-associated protein MTA